MDGIGSLTDLVTALSLNHNILYWLFGRFGDGIISASQYMILALWQSRLQHYLCITMDGIFSLADLVTALSLNHNG